MFLLFVWCFFILGCDFTSRRVQISSISIQSTIYRFITKQNIRTKIIKFLEMKTLTLPRQKPFQYPSNSSHFHATSKSQQFFSFGFLCAIRFWHMFAFNTAANFSDELYANDTLSDCNRFIIKLQNEGEFTMKSFCICCCCLFFSRPNRNNNITLILILCLYFLYLICFVLLFKQIQLHFNLRNEQNKNKNCCWREEPNEKLKISFHQS